MFTDAELEILELLSEGLTNREISQKRFTTISATKAHLINIYKKMGIKHESNARLKAVLIYKEQIQ